MAGSAPPDWGRLVRELEQLMPHLAMARTAKAQLYQMGSVSSQLVLAGADEPPEAVMLQRLRGCGPRC